MSNRFNFYRDIKEDDNVLIISVNCDVPVSELVKNIPSFSDTNAFDSVELVKAGTSIFMDKKSGALALRLKNKDLVLFYGDKKLYIDFTDKGYIFRDGKCEYNSNTLTDDSKHELYKTLTEFIRNFRIINGYLPIDSTFTFIFLQMGILNEDEIQIVSQDNGVILYLNSFRSLNLKKLKLNIADSHTYEVVGTIDLSLNEKNESNFSYSGNVSYKINDGYENRGFATDALKTLIEYVKSLGDEYNKELYIASLVDDLAYQAVAIKNGAVLVYEGDIPESDTPLELHKIDQIKIYRINDK